MLNIIIFIFRLVKHHSIITHVPHLCEILIKLLEMGCRPYIINMLAAMCKFALNLLSDIVREDFLGIITQDPSVSKSNRLVDIFWFFLY